MQSKITPSGRPRRRADSNARTDLVTLINSAKKSLDVEDEEFSDNNSERRHRRGRRGRRARRHGAT